MFTLWSTNTAGLRPAPATTMWVRGKDRVLGPAACSSCPRTGLWNAVPGLKTPPKEDAVGFLLPGAPSLGPRAPPGAGVYSAGLEETGRM